MPISQLAGVADVIKTMGGGHAAAKSFVAAELQDEELWASAEGSSNGKDRIQASWGEHQLLSWPTMHVAMQPVLHVFKSTSSCSHVADGSVRMQSGAKPTLGHIDLPTSIVHKVSSCLKVSG